MKKSITYNPYKEPVKIIIITYIVFSFISLIYSLTTGKYNGDFINSKVSLNSAGLIAAFIITIIPYIILYKFFLIFAKSRSTRVVHLKSNLLEPITILIFIIHILLSFFFGVGKAGGEDYNVPTIVKPFIQIMIRISPVTLGTLLLMIIPKKKYSKIATIVFLFILLGITRASFGFISLLIPIFVIKYYTEFKHLFRNHKLVFLTLSLLIPPMIKSGYEARSYLRGDNYEVPEDTITLVCGKLIGRLSSFSNTAILIEKAPQYIIVANSIDPQFFERGILSAISQNFTLENRPEKILMLDERVPENASFILGTGGILIFSLYISPQIIIKNIFFILIIDIMVFKLCSLFRNPLGSVIALLLLLAPTLSGVAGEYFLCVIQLCLAIIIISGVNNIIQKSHIAIKV